MSKRRCECFVLNCRTGRRNYEGHVFGFPKTRDKELRSLWLEKLPQRERPFDFDKDVVCHLHFSEEQLDKCWKTKVGEVTVTTPKDRWRIKDGAFPSIFPESPYSQRKSGAIAKMPKKSEEKGGEMSMLPPGYKRMLANACKSQKRKPTGKAEVAPKRKLQKSLNSTKEESQTEEKAGDKGQAANTDEAAKVQKVIFVLPKSSPMILLPKESVPVISEVRTVSSEKEISSAVAEIVAPSGLDLLAIANQLKLNGLISNAWACDVVKDWQTDTQVLCCVEMGSSFYGMEVTKSITISSEGQPKIHFRKTDVSSKFPETKCSGYADVASLFDQVRRTTLCSGLSSCDGADAFCNGARQGGMWFSESCERMVADGGRQCRKCRLKERSLTGDPKDAPEKDSLSQLPPDQLREQLRDMIRDQTFLKQRLIRVKQTNAQLLQEVKGLRAVRDTRMAEVDGLLRDLGIPEKQQLVVNTAVLASKHAGKAASYSSEWLLECNGLLRTSNKAYEHLRKKQILPLPSMKCLRRLLKQIPLASTTAGKNVATVEVSTLEAEDEDDEETTVIITEEEQLRQLLESDTDLQTEEVVILPDLQDHIYA